MLECFVRIYYLYYRNHFEISLTLLWNSTIMIILLKFEKNSRPLHVSKLYLKNFKITRFRYNIMIKYEIRLFFYFAPIFNTIFLDFEIKWFCAYG